MTAETSNARGEWVLVPRNPTEAMIDAWRDAPDIWDDAYAAMLAAAPQPPSALVGVEDGPIDASDNAEYIEHCADRLERCGLRVTAGALRVIAHEHRTLAQQLAPPSAPVGVEWPLSLLRAEHWREVYIGHRCMRLEVTYDYATWERLMAEIESALAQQPAAVDEGSRIVTSQLLHWGGIPVRVTGTVTTSPGNWPLIDAAQHQEPTT